MVISVLLGVNGLLLWQFFEKKAHLDEVSAQLTTTISEKDSLENELNKLKEILEKANRENQSLHSRLSDREQEIKSKMDEIQRLISSGDAAQLERAKIEMERLKQLNQSYLAQIDTLKSENANLSALNSRLNNTLASEINTSTNLSQENQRLSNKVAMGSILKAVELRATGVKYKSSGKETETTRAGAADGIKTCFTIVENNVVDGKSRLHPRIEPRQRGHVNQL
jgi:chromosome segregation ATPase